MIQREVHIVLASDVTGKTRTLRAPMWLLALAPVLLLGLGACGVLLWGHLRHVPQTDALAQAQQTIQDQQTQLTSLTGKAKALEKDLLRVRDFDAKLRSTVLQSGSERLTVSTQPGRSSGGPDSRDLARNQLAMHRQELAARQLHAFLAQLSADTRLEEAHQQELILGLRDRYDALAAIPTAWPVEGWISCTFGPRASPFTGNPEFHKGIDISCPVGTPIYAPARGVVMESGVDGGYGLRVTMDHGQGLLTRYAHLESIAVRHGQVVKRGEVIGFAGNTGRSTGPHLHYEVRVAGMPINPATYILE